MYHNFVSGHHDFLQTEPKRDRGGGDRGGGVKEANQKKRKVSGETKRASNIGSGNEMDNIIGRMQHLDVFDYEVVCWKMLTGQYVSKKEKRQLTTLHKNIKNDTGMKVISGTALASYKDGTGSPLSGSYIFRYTMELIKNLSDSEHGTSGNDILVSLLSQSEFEPVIQTILDVVNKHYKPDENLTSFQQFECWKQVVNLNAETIQSLSKQANRMLTLEECQHISVTVPDGLNNESNVVRAVNAFSVRVLNTPYKKTLDTYNDSSLSSSSFTHVAGSSERSQKTFSNKSVAMSLTDEMERAVRYAIFYAQVIPIVVFIQINKVNAIPTTSVLEYGEKHSDKKYASGQAYNIAEKHHEYIPKTVSYIDPRLIEDMRPLLMTPGPIFQVGDDMGPYYPQEHWHVHTPIYVNENHQHDSKIISHGTFHNIKLGDRVTYVWNPPKETYDATVVKLTLSRVATLKFDDGDKKTFQGGWFNEKNYGKQWWYAEEEDVRMSEFNYSSTSSSKKSSSKSSSTRKRHAPTLLTPDEKKVFEEWCSTWHIVKTDPRKYIMAMNLRVKDAKSYENYCAARSKEPIRMTQFVAAMKAKGRVTEKLRKRGGGVAYYDIAYVDEPLEDMTMTGETKDDRPPSKKKTPDPNGRYATPEQVDIIQAWYDEKCEVNKNLLKKPTQATIYHRTLNSDAKKSFEKYRAERFEEFKSEFPKHRSKDKLKDFLTERHRLYKKGSGAMWYEFLVLKQAKTKKTTARTKKKKPASDGKASTAVPRKGRRVRKQAKTKTFEDIGLR